VEESDKRERQEGELQKRTLHEQKYDNSCVARNPHSQLKLTRTRWKNLSLSKKNS